MIERRLRKIHERLQGKKPHLPHFLTEIHMQGIRGIHDLRMTFDYPVSVIAGGNASGKSTALSVAACAYKAPGAGAKHSTPSTLFPDYRPGPSKREDGRHAITLDFNYVTPHGQRAMRWRRSKDWNRSFLGRKNATQPERQVYLHTPSNLDNLGHLGHRAEVRKEVPDPSRSKSPPRENRETPMTASQIAFAQQILPFSDGEVVDRSDPSSGSEHLPFATQQHGTAYSELHMSAGERTILRLSREIAQLDGALILIDEVEAGLHPWVQRLLMLHLQQLALRNDLQIIVTSHSPTVLDSVPPSGRIFLDRDPKGKITVCPPYRDIVRNALYGRSDAELSLLCEGEAAEGILRGVFDSLSPRLGIKGECIRIEGDTGTSEFPAFPAFPAFPTYARTLGKFGRIENFVFVLNGDQRDSELAEKIRSAGDGHDVPILFLPGSCSPEAWVWKKLSSSHDSREELPIEIAEILGIDRDRMVEEMRKLDAMYDSASDPPAEIAKAKLQSLADSGDRSSPEICRAVARRESEKSENLEGDLRPLVDELTDVVEQWRTIME